MSCRSPIDTQALIAKSKTTAAGNGVVVISKGIDVAAKVAIAPEDTSNEDITVSGVYTEGTDAYSDTEVRRDSRNARGNEWLGTHSSSVYSK